MKYWKLWACIVAFSSFFALGAEQSPREGHGGDAVAIEFRAAAVKVAALLKEAPFAQGSINPDDFEDYAHSAKITSQARTVLDGTEVDAINYPDARPRKIVVSRSRWFSPDNTANRKLVLAFHEILSLMRIED